jgi:2-C-methyl-D-erythritol 4-phosphate cytidylyltransferase
VDLAGHPVLSYAIRAAMRTNGVEGLIVVAPAGREEDARMIAAAALASATGDLPADREPLRLMGVVPGGSTRQASVRAGLAATAFDVEVVVCHDAARPFASSALFDGVVGALRLARSSDDGVGGAIPVLASPDTLKRVGQGRVVETIPREGVGLAQTPQAFDAAVLRSAHELALERGLDATDDAMLVEAAGFDVVTVPGEASNFKVTTPEDLRRAEFLAKDRFG